MKQKRIFYTIIFLLFCSVCSIAQTKIIRLKNEKLKVLSNEFYFAEVKLERSSQNTIGRMYDGSQAMSVALEGGVAKAFENFLNRNFNASNIDTLTSIYLVINELKIEEKFINQYKVRGDISLKLSFEMYRDGQMINLTSGSATGNYTRSPQNDEIVEPLLRNMIKNQLIGFKKWFDDSKKSDKLAKSVRVILDEESPIQNYSDTVYYDKNRPLVWTDFKGAGRFGSRWAAQVFTSFGMEVNATVSNRVVNLHIKIQVWLDKTISWVRPDAKNDYTLAHEQLHFDITKLVAERFKKKVSNMLFTVEDFSSEIQYQYLEYYRQMSQTQQDYDGDTNHGIDKAEQQRWIEKVKKELNELETKNK